MVSSLLPSRQFIVPKSVEAAHHPQQRDESHDSPSQDDACANSIEARLEGQTSSEQQAFLASHANSSASELDTRDSLVYNPCCCCRHMKR